MDPNAAQYTLASRLTVTVTVADTLLTDETLIDRTTGYGDNEGMEVGTVVGD